jgi:hypothetical protein
MRDPQCKNTPLLLYYKGKPAGSHSALGPDFDGYFYSWRFHLDRSGVLME